MPRLKLTVQYAGTGLHGWQAQPLGDDGRGGLKPVPSVEGHLQAAWMALTQDADPTTFHVAGRTDGGVHAWANVCHIDTDWAHAEDTIKVMGGLNRFLPDSVRVVRVSVVEAEGFHARYHATDRAYCYLMYNKRYLRPDLVGRAGHVRVTQRQDNTGGPLDYMKMWQAMQALPLGENDYSGFRDAECQSKRPVCNLLWREILDLGDGMYRLNIRADHFLHHMVRNIVGTLVEIGQGDRPVTGLADVLAGKDRTLCGPTFSPDGLYLTGVTYPAHEERGVVAG